MQGKLTQAIIIDFLNQTRGWISTRHIWSELGIITPEAKASLRTILARLCAAEDNAQPYLQRDSKRAGWVRRVETERTAVNLGRVGEKIIKVKWPFGLERYVQIPTKGIVIVAGDKDAGKTAFVDNFISLNMYDHEIHLFTNEVIGTDVTDRFYDINPEAPDPLPFHAWEQYDNFGDVIEPNKINVIDYLDTNSEFYLVGDEIDKIFRKLKNGMALIAMQKPLDSVFYVKGQRRVVRRDLAYGGTPTTKRSILYFSLSSNLLKIVFAKKRANPKINPKDMQWTFHLDDKGAKFLNIQEKKDEFAEEGFI